MENKKEYLKKYLNEEPKKKKKKIKVKKPAVVNPRIKIIDDDINVKSLAHDSEEEEIGEEAPQIVAIIDETRKARWKTLGDSTENVPRKRLDSDSDLSPPRPTEIQQNSENLQRKQRFDTDSDQSPPRPNQNKTKTNYSDDDLSPLRSKRRNSETESDQSLPRSRSSKKHSNKSRKKQFERSDSDSDLSLSRNRSSKKHSEKSRRKQYEKSDSDHDVSLIRNRSSKKHSEKSRKKQFERSDSDSDLSLPRSRSSKKHSEKLQKRQSERSDSDISSSQKRHKKKHKKHSRKSSSPEVAYRKGKGNEKIDNEKMDKKLKNDIQKTSKKELKQISNIELEAVQKEAENEEDNGKDVAKTNIDEDNAEPEVKGTALARYKDDPELEDHLKSILREGDPMLAYIRKKQLKNQDETTENVQAYKGPPAPPNRFNINPGHRWDGVDRSNGFEKKYFDNIAQRKAFEELAYKWSVEDM
ncbi:BUD13 homolog [Centruroides vittatus]|uniref:BUD13 homolog n=1 Tax=Centruroides vittatus TaxID=120091 RepID=UPI00350FE1E2